MIEAAGVFLVVCMAIGVVALVALVALLIRDWRKGRRG